MACETTNLENRTLEPCPPCLTLTSGVSFCASPFITRREAPTGGVYGRSSLLHLAVFRLRTVSPPFGRRRTAGELMRGDESRGSILSLCHEIQNTERN
eukprot:s425_g22.t1